MSSTFRFQNDIFFMLMRTCSIAKSKTKDLLFPNLVTRIILSNDGCIADIIMDVCQVH